MTIPIRRDFSPIALDSTNSTLTAPNLPSHFRRVFQTDEQMHVEFTHFLKTIFFQLDEKKVFREMKNLLEDPNKTDEQIYRELCKRMPSMKKSAPVLSRLWSLFVLKKGMGEQANALLKNFDKKQFHDYLEIYDRRYLKTLQSQGFSLDGQRIALCNNSSISLIDRIQAGALFSLYPYKAHVALHDVDDNSLLQPEKTYKALGEEIVVNSLDLIACLGGLHHIPKERRGAFIASLHTKLRPGGVVLLREHNAPSGSTVASLAATVHSFVNAANNIPWSIENREIRDFASIEEWSRFMESHGFTRISHEPLVLKDDPTHNAMIAFTKTPKTFEELKKAISYRRDGTRLKQSTRATWIEWGNVRSSKQYADFIQNHHAYAFDFIGHIRQHWQHFYYFIKESLQDPEVHLKNLLFSDDMAMNLFILLTTTIQYGISSISTLPSRLLASWKYGENWREVCNLSALEKFEAETHKDYADFIDHTPFYMYPYLDKIQQMWRVIGGSKETPIVKMRSSASAALLSLDFLAKAIISFPIRYLYTTEAYKEPETITLLIKDPNNELNTVLEQWRQDTAYHEDLKIRTLYHTDDNYKLIAIPRYKPFTRICSYLIQTDALNLVEIGGQKEISLDLLLDENTEAPSIFDAKCIYEMKKLQDVSNRRFLTYQVNVCALKKFKDLLAVMEYIHE